LWIAYLEKAVSDRYNAQAGIRMAICAFCQMLRGETVVSLVHSDEKVAAFMDIQPVNPGHVLIVPKMHAASLSDLDEETGGQMFRLAMRISKAVRKIGLQCEGVNMLLADGQVAGQEILHVHLHVIPRFNGDGFGLKFGVGQKVKMSRVVLNEVAGRIRTALAE
jgi:histidine triad (HIT) family protein